MSHSHRLANYGQKYWTLVFNDPVLERRYHESRLGARQSSWEKRWILVILVVHIFWRVVMYAFPAKMPPPYHWTVHVHSAALVVYVTASYAWPETQYLKYRDVSALAVRALLMGLHALGHDRNFPKQEVLATSVDFYKLLLASTGVLFYVLVSFLISTGLLAHIWLQGSMVFLFSMLNYKDVCRQFFVHEICSAARVCAATNQGLVMSKFSQLWGHMSCISRYWQWDEMNWRVMEQVAEDPVFMCHGVASFLQVFVGFGFPTLVMYCWEARSRALFLQKVVGDLQYLQEQEAYQRYHMQYYWFELGYQVVAAVWKFAQFLAILYVVWELVVLTPLVVSFLT